MGSSSVQGHPAVIDALNTVLTGELTSINQYFVHAELCEHWGFDKLHGKIRKESIDEMKHAESLVERVLFLGGMPNVQRLGKVTIGETVPEILELDRVLENEAIPRLRDAIALCHTHGDHGTRTLLESILRSEEEHIDWIDAQLELIARVGLENYLASRI